MAAVTAAAIGAGTAIYSAKQASKQAKSAQAAADPFAPNRGQYAEQLNKLMADPSSITETPEYKARLEAVARTLASQGYAGSGNMAIEAANAGGAAFQQAYDRLAVLSGATTGSPAAASQAAVAGGQQRLETYAGAANNITNLASTLGDRFNKAAQPATTTSTSTGSKNFVKGL